MRHFNQRHQKRQGDLTKPREQFTNQSPQWELPDPEGLRISSESLAREAYPASTQ